MRVVTIDEESVHFEAVIELGNANSSTLGFLPYGAYKRYAAQGQIRVALDDNDGVLGYLLYNTNQREMLAYIVHLCVHNRYRQRGIGEELVGPCASFQL